MLARVSKGKESQRTKSGALKATGARRRQKSEGLMRKKSMPGRSAPGIVIFMVSPLSAKVLSWMVVSSGCG